MGRKEGRMEGIYIGGGIRQQEEEEFRRRKRRKRTTGLRFFLVKYV